MRQKPTLNFTFKLTKQAMNRQPTLNFTFKLMNQAMNRQPTLNFTFKSMNQAMNRQPTLNFACNHFPELIQYSSNTDMFTRTKQIIAYISRAIDSWRKTLRILTAIVPFVFYLLYFVFVWLVWKLFPLCYKSFSENSIIHLCSLHVTKCYPEYNQLQHCFRV